MTLENIITKLDKIVLLSTKYNYVIYIDGRNRIVFKTPLLKIPFGVEKYNNKFIINFELQKFAKANSNINYNFVSGLSCIDGLFQKLVDDDSILKYKLPHGMNKELEGKNYMSCIKFNSVNMLFRVHVKKPKDLKIFSVNDAGEKKYYDLDEIKGKECMCEITLDNLWTHGNNYGLVWFVNEIQIF